MYLNIPKPDIQRLKSKNILITGANGFVGSHLLRALESLSLNYQILAHNSTTGEERKGWFSDDSAINENFDCVIHLAGLAHIHNSSSQNTYKQFHQANVAYTEKVFQKALQANVSRFIYISTIGVYGVYSSEESITEDHELVPAIDYAKSKLEGEKLIKELCHKNNMDFVILRPSLVYGEDAPGNLNRLKKLCSKRVLLPFGLANNKRTMVSVNNLISAIVKCLHHPAAKNNTFNVADDIGVSTSDLCHYYSSMSGNKCYIIPVPKVILKVLLTLLGKRMLYSQLFGPLNISNKKIKDELHWIPPDKPSDFFVVDDI